MAKKAPAKKKAVKKPTKRVVKKVIKLIDVSKVESADHLIVEVVEDKTDLFHTAIGISDERATELTKAAHMALITTSKMCAAINQVSKVCKHANELAYAVMSITDIRMKIHSHLGGPMR